MRALILGAALLAVGACATAEAQGLRETVARCAQAAGPTAQGQKIESIEIVTSVIPVERPGAPKGTPFLLLKVRNPDGSRWKVTCNGAAAAVVDVEREVSSAYNAPFQRKIAEADARKAALEAYPGQILGVAYEIGSNGTPQYEFDLKPASGEAGLMVDVNATNGQIAQVWTRAYALPTR